MKNYSVKDISEALGTNQETVRRWIRTGKLKASQNSKKDGNEISEKSLIDFLETSPKYFQAAKGSSLLSGILAGIVPGSSPILATLLTGNILNAEVFGNGQVNPKSIVKTISDLISEAEMSIDKKRQEIKQLNQEIHEEEKRISDLKSVLEGLRHKK